MAAMVDAEMHTDAELVEQSLQRQSRIRARFNAYPRPVWMMALANLVLWTGRGMIMPFVVIFFSQIAGLSASAVGTGIAVSGLGGIVFVSLVAGQIDRRGGRPVLLCCLGAVAISTLFYPWSTGLLPFFAVTIVLNFAGQVYWPASDATFASLQRPEGLAQAFMLLRVASAVGVGLGGLIGGAMVAGGGMAQYRMLFTASGLVVVAAMAIVWLLVPVDCPAVHRRDRSTR